MSTSINLLPDQCLWRNLLRMRLRQWSLIWLCTLLAGGVVYYKQHRDDQAASYNLAALERLYTPVKAMEDNLKTLQVRKRKLAQHQLKIAPMVDERPLLTLLGHVSQSAEASGLQLRIANFQFRRGERIAAEKDQKTNTDSPNRLSLQGDANDYVTVMKFVSSLRDTKAFANVELKSTVRKDRGTTQNHTYLVECNF